MFLANCFGGAAFQYDLIRETYALPDDAGLKLSFSQFDGYSPVLEGSIRTRVAESDGSEKSGDIVVTINVKASSPKYNENIRIRQEKNSISISTGGLTSMLSYISAPRLLIEVIISLPRTVGDIEIESPSLPVFMQSERTNDVVIRTTSSAISVSKIDARSLTVSTQSGSITFEDFSKQKVDKFTKITNQSGSTTLRSSISCPDLTVESNSGSIRLGITATAEELKVKGLSGSISGAVEYVKDVTSVSSFQNSSGSTMLDMRGWTGFLTAENGSGSKKVSGRGLERWNEGWKKGNGESTAAFKSQSGSIKVEVS